MKKYAMMDSAWFAMNFIVLSELIFTILLSKVIWKALNISWQGTNRFNFCSTFKPCPKSPFIISQKCPHVLHRDARWKWEICQFCLNITLSLSSKIQKRILKNLTVMKQDTTIFYLCNLVIRYQLMISTLLWWILMGIIFGQFEGLLGLWRMSNFALKFNSKSKHRVTNHWVPNLRVTNSRVVSNLRVPNAHPFVVTNLWYLIL